MQHFFTFLRVSMSVYIKAIALQAFMKPFTAIYGIWGSIRRLYDPKFFRCNTFCNLSNATLAYWNAIHVTTATMWWELNSRCVCALVRLPTCRVALRKAALQASGAAMATSICRNLLPRSYTP